eukprot:CAMPEP_0171325034 /NCGR_PEP_ID=MMETSP0816-20121228/116559_1 /TAXON_ID=420281 /ORGANISM="Proboscia inermis, Strain CCAP1064/1" /LENGTH=364 /DNA_ID=CAMNT_0011824119 /DNA_START=143 /DNA_END=1237 /DNA_ORIENTATION=+
MSTNVEFAKYEGLGNDFILIDDRDKEEPSLTSDQSAKLCDRNFGIGGDGVIFALKAPSDDYSFKFRIYNSDGSEPEMCGNGIRCYAQFLKDLGADAKSYRVDTLAGQIIPVMNDDGTITVDMGPPILSGPAVPCTLEPNLADSNSIVEQTLTDKNGKEWKVSAISMGNPHAIIFVDDLDSIDFEVDGPALEGDVNLGPPILSGPAVPCTLEPNLVVSNSIVEQTLTDKNGKEWKVSAISMGNPHAIIFVDDLDSIDFEVDGPALEGDVNFPARTNVEFVQVMSPSHLKMKVWERGAGPTLACGTGACALTVAAILADKIPRSGEEGTRVTLPGGDLFIEWRESDNKVYMKGPGTLAFKGTVTLD